MGFVPAIEFK